ncbi:hypothetical protein CC1G_08320 [Coprinopsis cinerea okayama7|uniref:Uncharacterized protein n=1 Tax=Coprinopsis cinerea (strain Okayama-7 / 130 / ATCC MYA-4618 / FGSC 9003) TaxID=240176 RepID=A8NA61_COPC7|nr:hypothetical protein CC1G_08320 [Coprinopsis cinerea okayama7\|eukprot:XP_001831716.2 hypothetical protein CC1G_08320 [Coprinopsis cinerea okayama7\
MPPVPGQLVQANIAALAIGGFVSFALIVWDFIAYLPDEIRLLKDFRKVSWRTPDPYSFLLVRYSALGYGLASLFNLALKSDHCQAVVSWAQVLSICVLIPAGVLSARRVASLWSNHMAVVSVGTVLFVCMISSWIAVASQHRGFTLKENLLVDGYNEEMGISPLPGFGTNCGVSLQVPWHSLSYIASTLFFGATFALALLRWSRQRTEHVFNLGLTPLNRACLWYLMVSWISCIALLAVYTSSWSTDISRRTASPFFVLLVAGMAQRIFLNSQADYTLRKQHIQEMAMMNLKAKVPRWSWSPHAKKVSLSTISTGGSPRAAPLTNFGSHQIYPRPPPPPPPLPISNPGSPSLTPLPPQHILSIEKSRAGKVSPASSMHFKPSSSNGHDASDSTERLVTPLSTGIPDLGNKSSNSGSPRAQKGSISGSVSVTSESVESSGAVAANTEVLSPDHRKPGLDYWVWFASWVSTGPWAAMARRKTTRGRFEVQGVARESTRGYDV